MGKRILLINDLPGYGKVALAAMLPILSGMGHHVYNLPTALVSNTLDYGKFDILETTEYMSNTMAVWEELGFAFEAAATGFIVSEKQAELIAGYCARLKETGTIIFADPIMGDVGRLYNGVTEKTVRHMIRLISVADYIVPNYTEAAYLAGMPYREDGITLKEAKELVSKLHEIGAGSVIITSARVDGQDAVIAYDRKEDEIQILPFQAIPVRFPGTGDIFSAVFMGEILSGSSVAGSVQKAMDCIEKLIRKN